MEKNICVCIEGELRGSNRCGPSIKKNLIDHLNADLYFCLQKYPGFCEDDLKFYGEFKKAMIYENPIPNFKEIFNDLCKRFEIQENAWERNFNFIKDGNYTLGYDKPGTCIRRMYNRYLLYEMLENTNYEWFVILRSDMYFVDLFYHINFFEKGNLTVCRDGGWGGLNNNFIVFDRSIMKNVLMYIKNFLNGQLLNYIKCNRLIRFDVNEEKFFRYNMQINEVSIKTMKNMWYISADNINGRTTWKVIKMAGNGDIYKYDYDYKNAQKVFFSQIGQDEYYVKNVINYRKNGVFLDIGAHDGKTLSNTFYLESILGWKGICVEPNPINKKKCEQDRKVIICDKAIYEKSDITVDFVIPCGKGYVEGGIDQLCGIDGKIHKKLLDLDFRQQYSEKNIIHVNTININDLLDQYNIHNIDYMSLDTNGYEMDILKMIDYNKNTIHFMTVSHCKDIEYQQSIYSFLTEKKYKRHRINKWDDEYILCDENI